MLFLLTVAVFALAVTSIHAQILTPGFIAGYCARTQVDDYLLKDLVQKQLENIIEDEECDTFEQGRQFYFNLGVNPPWLSAFPDGGTYLRTIPTYGLNNGEVKSAEYKEYIKWAGNNDDFHKIWVAKAFNKEVVNEGEMTADFTNGTAFPYDPIYDPFSSGQCVGFEEVVKKTTAYVFNFIESVQLMEAAIQEAKDGCVFQQDGCDDALKFWDGAAAIFVGSCEGEDGREVDGFGDRLYGKSLYGLGDKLCRIYKTCGPERNQEGNRLIPASINTKILAYFSAGQHAIYAGDWALATDFKKLISAKMAVPWIQGTFRFAWRLSAERSRANDALVSNTDPLDGNGNVQVDPDLPDPALVNTDYSELDKEVGEAAAFALGAVPKLWACTKNAAELVWSELELGGGVAGQAPVNFQLIKLAFECNYKCLLTSCKEVGSLYDNSPTIRNGAKTCKDSDFGTDPKGYSKCKPIIPSIRNGKCKFFRGNPGIIARDKLKYFKETLP